MAADWVGGSASYRVSLINLYDVIRTLERLPEIYHRAGTEAMERSAIKVQNDARKNCPVRTGRLRRSIAYELDAGKQVIQARVGSNVEYAEHVERGTRKMGARPYLLPALESNRGFFRSTLAACLIAASRRGRAG